MLRVEIGIVSNRCGCGGATTRKTKLLYAGTTSDGLEKFLRAANAFLPDEQHRYTIEHRFTVFCSSETTATEDDDSIETWPRLCYTIDQFFCFPMTEYTMITTDREHIVRMLITDEQHHCLLNILFNLQRVSRGFPEPPSVIYAHPKDENDSLKRLKDCVVAAVDDDSSALSHQVFAKKLAELRKLRDEMTERDDKS